MATGTATGVEALRIDPEDFKRRLAAGEKATVIDLRAPKAWDASNEKVRGAVRATADQFRADPSWPKGQLTVAY
jgi:hypothetical protein